MRSCRAALSPPQFVIDLFHRFDGAEELRLVPCRPRTDELVEGIANNLQVRPIVIKIRTSAYEQDDRPVQRDTSRASTSISCRRSSPNPRMVSWFICSES